ncbi:MAG: metallophosphoesterase [Anaerolineaceae bacterium]
MADIHANYPALLAVLDELKKMEISTIWLLGDALGRGAYPAETYTWVNKTFTKRSKNYWVSGNHENWVLGTEGESWRQTANPIFVRTDTMERKELSVVQGYPGVFASLQTIVEYSNGNNYDSYLTHECLVNSTSTTLLPWNIALAKENFLWLNENRPGEKSKILLVAHTHVPALFVQDRSDGTFTSRKTLPFVENILESCFNWIINPGSVGYPLDNDPRASFGVLDMEECTYRLIKKEYVIDTTITQIYDKKYPLEMIEHLRTAPLPANTPIEWYEHFQIARKIKES